MEPIKSLVLQHYKPKEAFHDVERGLWVHAQLNSTNPLEISVQLLTAEGSSDKVLTGVLSLAL